MWNRIRTDEYEGMIAEKVTIRGWHGDSIGAYYSRPMGEGPHPGIVLVPHMPGWDEFCRETARRFSAHGYSVLCPDIFARVGAGYPDQVAAMARQTGGVADDCVMGDCESSLRFLASQPASNGKIGIIGMCSGGRHAFLAACTVPGFSAAVDLWGGHVVAPKEALTPSRPVAPIDYTEQLSCPLLGIFGNDDKSPSPADVDTLEAALKKYGKNYSFHRYDGAGHGIWYYHNGMYRQEAAMDSWEKVFAFFGENLGG